MTFADDDRLGPVDIYLLGLPGERPDQAAMTALTVLLETGPVRLLDLILISKAEEGALALLEAQELPDGFEIDVEPLGATGLLGKDDVDDLAASIPAGTAALLVALELTYQRDLAARTAQSGATLLGYERIPAPVVNALLDSLSVETEE